MPGLSKEERRIRQTLQAQIDDTEEIAVEARQEAFTPYPTRRVISSPSFVGTVGTGTGTGTVTSNHGELDSLDDDDHTQYVHNTEARTISANHTFTGIPIFNGGTSGSSAPFSVDSNTKVALLNADLVDDKQPGTSAGDIAYYDSNTRVVDSQKLDGLDSSGYFILSESETITGIPAFNGGETGTSAPFSVDSTDEVTNLNASLLSGKDWDAPLAIGSTTAAAGSFTSLVGTSLDLNGNLTISGSITGDATSSGNLSISSGGDVVVEGTTFSGDNVTVPGDLTAPSILSAADITMNPTGKDVFFSTQANKINLGTSNYNTSLFTGNGWRLFYDANDKNHLVLDNLSIRGTMTVWELLIMQIRATNGSLFVTSAARVASVTDLGSSTYRIEFETDTNKPHPFAEDDLILAKRVHLGTGSGGYGGTSINESRMTVTDNTPSGYAANFLEAELVGGYGAPAEGYDFVRVGNTSDVNRRGGIYLTSDDNNAPFVDVFNDVDSWSDWQSVGMTKTRFGKLDGIASNTLSPSGYGLYGENVFLSGHMRADTGYIGTAASGWDINTGHIVNGKVKLDAQNQLIKVGDVVDFSKDGTDVKGVLIGKDGSTSDYEFFAGNESGHYIHWDGSNLNVKGVINVQSGSSGVGDVTDYSVNNTQANLITGTTITGGGVQLNSGGSIRTNGIAYGGDGIFFGYSGSAYKLSCVNSSTAYIKWDGSALDVKGAITATSGTFTGAVNASSGNITGALTVKDTITVGTASDNGAIKLYGNTGTGGKIHTSGKDTFSDGTAGFFLGYDGVGQYDLALGDASKYMKWDGSAGTLTIRGTLNADDIVAGTLTGRTVQTASSGTRVELNGSANTVSLYDSIGKQRVLVDDSNDAPIDQASNYYAADSSTGSNVSLPVDSENAPIPVTCDSTTIYTSYPNRQVGARVNFTNAGSGNGSWNVKVEGYNGSSWVEVWFSGTLTQSAGNAYAVYPQWTTTGDYSQYRIRATKIFASYDIRWNDTYWRVFDTFTELNNGGVNWSGSKLWARMGMTHISNDVIDANTVMSAYGTTHLYQYVTGGSGSAIPPPLILSNSISDTHNFKFHFVNADLHITSKGGRGGYIDESDAGVGQMNFTGQHRAIGNSGMTAAEYGDMVGYIVRADGKYNNIQDNSTSPTINDSMPVIELSDTNNDKKVFGVISSHEEVDDDSRKFASGSWVTISPKTEGDERVIINSLGEGAIWITNINGNLENGDYITSSTAAGLGQKQDDDLLHNYTVAKITQDCDFSSGTEFEHNGNTYKKQFVGCTYHCG